MILAKYDDSGKGWREYPESILRSPGESFVGLIPLDRILRFSRPVVRGSGLNRYWAILSATIPDFTGAEMNSPLRVAKVFAAIALTGCLTVLAISTSEIVGQEKIKPALDPERAFQLGDTDKDGKLSREEFAKLMANNPRVKDNPKGPDILFNRLDENKDGFLTLDEFKKIAELGPPGGKNKLFPKKDAPKKSDPAPTVTEKPTPDQLTFFEKKVRPVLASQCYSCHSEEAKKEKGGLRLDTREAIRKGGDSGAAVVPGSTSRSLLVKAVKQQDEHVKKMPPKSKLSDEVVADLEKWISSGAADPRDGAKVAAKEIDIEKGRQFWAFQAPKAVAPPAVQAAAWPRTDVDTLLLAGLEAKRLKPVGDADPRSLIRRLYFDLTGLPPTPEDVEAFAKDPSPAAFTAVVDKLLDSPRFGETWGRHWLDVARYAESSGKTANFNHPQAWRYRDYVIAAFNADKPYDQFIKEQLAGDLMPSSDPATKAERIVATGFLALGPKALNERNGLQFELDVADEQIDVTTQAFLGITAACARCHDHKFDPIPQKDYYALAGIFRSTETCYGTVRFVQSQRPSPLIELPDGSAPSAITEKLSDKQRADIEKSIKDLQEKMASVTDPINNIFNAAQVSINRSKLDSYYGDGTPKLLAMGARDKTGGGGGFVPKSPKGPGFGPFGGSRSVADSPLYARGEPDKPSADRVPRGTMQVMSKAPLKIKSSASGRLEFAEWIASKDNPLTARVMVNRVWLHLFGRGIVPTADNFGAAGQPPTNPALLDHLALKFVNDGWSVKKLIKSLVMSHAYQLDSKFDNVSFDADPDNALVWRMSPRRLEAEALRDAMLAISGQLNTKPPVGSVVAKVGEGPTTRPRLGGEQIGAAINDPRNSYRSVYLPIIREQLPEALTLFDFPDPNSVAGERAISAVPAQALYLMNNPFVIRNAEYAADRLLASSGTDAEKVKRGYETFYARPPSEKEQQAAMSFIANYEKRSTRRNSWAAFTQALFASAEFANLR
jgi:cytochrome c553